MAIFTEAYEQANGPVVNRIGRWWPLDGGHSKQNRKQTAPTADSHDFKLHLATVKKFAFINNANGLRWVALAKFPHERALQLTPRLFDALFRLLQLEIEPIKFQL